MFNLYNFTAYQLAWFAVIIGAAQGFAWAGAAVALLVAGMHLRIRRDPIELKLMGLAAVIGILVDSSLAMTGQVRFAAAWPGGFAPYWMLSLWMAFATTLNHSLRWLIHRPVAAALLGAVGGPLAYLAGAELGALTLDTWAITLPFIAMLWMLAMITFSMIVMRATPLIEARSVHCLVACLVVAAFTVPAQVFARDTATREWHFDVSLDGRDIGEHRFTLRTDDQSRELTSEALFRVRFLFIDAYRYEHRSHERWRGDCLESLEARTNSNGKPTVVAGQRASGEFRIQSGSAAVLLDECVQTFAYWNPSILDARRLLNPQTGEYMEVKVLIMGREVMQGQQTDRYRLIGSGRTPLEIDIWYTPARDWVALESLTPEGRRLRYTRK